MKKHVWAAALKSCADPARAGHFLELLAATSAQPALQAFAAEPARILAALLSGSPALGNLLAANPAWLSVLDAESLEFARREQGLRRELSGLLQPLLEAREFAAALGRLRQFKQRELLRIAARDLARLAGVPEITRELSDVADVCLDGVFQVCARQLAERHGQPCHQDAAGRWQRTACCVLGLGKLGGQELNYSSDVDVIVVYSEEGSVFKEPPRKGQSPRAVLSNHQFFNRLAEGFIAEVARVTPEGTLYRIDLRLRPEGDAGPLARSLPGYENYYAQWGQTWERMMLIKARRVAGEAALADEFLEMINPFRYPRSLPEGVLREVAAMKERIETEVVKAGELERNVKLGRGGIREVEFVVQALQLLHAGRVPFLQHPQTLPTLEKLARYRLLAEEEAKSLAVAYCFLREVEHRLQMEENLQTHTIPAHPAAQARLARLMGRGTPAEFAAVLRQHAGNVRRVYDRLLRAEAPAAPTPFPQEFAGAEAEWKAVLARHGFRDVDKSFRVLREFVEGPGYVHVSPRTSELARQLLPRLFALCRGSSADLPPADVAPVSPPANAVGTAPQSTSPLPPRTLSDPDRVVTRLDSFISAYGARATLFELWNTHPAIFELLVLLFDRSEFLAEAAIRTPDLVDELVTSQRLRFSKTAADILRDLRHGLEDADQPLWLRRYHNAEQMRIGLRDILGLADAEQGLAEYSALADACLQYALEVVLRRHRWKTAPFVIIGLGKLGGAEINYGSDLDLLFVAPPKVRNLPKLQKLALEVVDLVSARTEAGRPFHTDARLRPDGEKGLLVNTLDAYEDYYRQRAQLWEIQSLTRTRPVAGDPALGAQFQRLAAALTDFRPENVAAGFPGGTALPPARGADLQPVVAGVSPATNPARRERAGVMPAPRLGLAAYTPDWKRKIHHMRMRIEKERTPAGKDDLAIKTGAGGLMDAEFVAQALCLEHGWQEAHTLRALERARKDNALPEAATLIENYRPLRRLEAILRRWSYEGEVVLPDDPAPYHRVAVRCGFATPEAFRAALAQWRRAVRAVYAGVFVP